MTFLGQWKTRMSNKLYIGTKVLSGLMIIMLVIFQVWIWVDPISMSAIADTTGVTQYISDPLTLPWWQWSLGFISTAIPMACLITVLYSLLNLVRHFETDEWFNSISVILLRRIGIALIAYSITDFIFSETILTLVLTITNEPGERLFSVALSSYQIIALIGAMLALIIAEAFERAQRQSEELQQII